MPRSAKEKPEIEFSVPETIELLNCTKQAEDVLWNQGSPDYLKAEKGMGSTVSFDPENCTSNYYYTQ